jgi:hypothetical protein
MSIVNDERIDLSHNLLFVVKEAPPFFATDLGMQRSTRKHQRSKSASKRALKIGAGDYP